jgi:hypothetical protein
MDELAGGFGSRHAKYPYLDVYALNETYMPHCPASLHRKKTRWMSWLVDLGQGMQNIRTLMYMP